MSLICNICENFNISKLVCSCKNKRELEDVITPDDVEFSLLKSEKRKFSDLIPNNDS